jgi:hypothetical protein
LETGRDRFLSYLLRGTAVADPNDLLEGDAFLRRQFCAACLLADAHADYDILTFVSETLPLLLRQLRRTTRRERVTYHGAVRGRIDWPATSKARLQNEVNPALYVCRPPQRQDDTPENQLVKFLLERLSELGHDMAQELQQAELWTAVSLTASPFHQRLTHIAFYLRQTLNHARLRAVTTPTAISPLHLNKARASKIELYGHVARLYGQYERVIAGGLWPDVYPILRRSLVLPAPASPLGDACLQLAALGFVQAQQNHAIIVER